MQQEKKKIVFIVNPISGTSSKKEFDKIVEKAIDREKYDYRIVRTEYAGHAAELTTQCVNDGVDICVAVGGDGTVNEVARSLTNSNTALGIVPCGSGNGLARHLCLPMSMKGSLRIINEGATDVFDYGIINEQPFFCTCGMGFDAYVSLKFSQSGKRGLSTYAKMVLREGLRYKGDTYDVTIEDAEGSLHNFDAFLIACANAAQYGNNTYIAPEASMRDGLLDVIIIEAIKRTSATKVLMDLFTKTLKDNPHVRHINARRLHIHRNTEGAVHFDGDPTTMGTDINISIVPAGLKAVVNAKHIEDKASPNKIVRRINRLFV